MRKSELADHPILRIGILLLLSLLSVCVIAQDLNPVASRTIAERPLADDGSTEVTVDLYLLDISSINDVEQRFDVDMLIKIAWTDPRLALFHEQRTGQERVMPLSQIWTPRGAIVNDRGLSAQLPEIVDVDEDGRVTYEQRYIGSLAARLSFRDFPFDRQVLPIKLVSYHYTPDEVRFADASAFHFTSDVPSAEGWRFSPRPVETGVLNVPGQTDTRPMLTVSIDADRKGIFYLLTMFLPMTLIVFMAWTVTKLPPDIVQARIGIATASIFSVVALGFTVRLGLPPIAYLTRADIYVVGCTLLVFVRLGFLVMETRFVKLDQLARATQLGDTASKLYLLLFALVVAVTAIT